MFFLQGSYASEMNDTAVYFLKLPFVTTLGGGTKVVAGANALSVL